MQTTFNIYIGSIYNAVPRQNVSSSSSREPPPPPAGERTSAPCGRKCVRVSDGKPRRPILAGRSDGRLHSVVFSRRIRLFLAVYQHAETSTRFLASFFVFDARQHNVRPAIRSIAIVRCCLLRGLEGRGLALVSPAKRMKTKSV